MSLEDKGSQLGETLVSDERVFGPADIEALAKRYDLPEKPKVIPTQKNPTLDELRKTLAEQGYDLPASQTPAEREIQRIRAQEQLAVLGRQESFTGDYGVSARAERLTEQQAVEIRQAASLNQAATAPKKGFLRRIFGL